LIEDEIVEEEVDVVDPFYDEGDDWEILYGDINETVVVRKK